MARFDPLFSLPVDPELWIVLCYVIVVLIGARITELLARMHFALARRRAERGFEYVVEDDHYRCPEGERLSLQSHDAPRGLAIYQAAPDRCASCALKQACVPGADSRRIYRSLITWAETDLGRFHRRISMLMFAAAAALSLVGAWKWSGKAGAGYLLVCLLASASSLAWDVWSRQSESRS